MFDATAQQKLANFERWLNFQEEDEAFYRTMIVFLEQKVKEVRLIQ
jgi:hypothetical protein